MTAARDSPDDVQKDRRSQIISAVTGEQGQPSTEPILHDRIRLR